MLPPIQGNLTAQAWCEGRGLDTVIHPTAKCVVFLEDLLEEMKQKQSKDPFGTIRVARKAIQDQVDYVSQKLASHGMMAECCMARELQRGVPPPYGEAFSKETLIPSACSKAFAATTQARIGET